MATFHNITEEEISNFLAPQGFEKLNLPGVRELVYGKRIDHSGFCLTLRIYSGIVYGQSRDVGEDAIRTTLFYRNDLGHVFKIGGSKRVHRVQGWMKNLQNRIDFWTKQPIEKCNECQAPMIPRNSKKNNNTFLGCVTYPACRNTRQIS